MMIDNIEHSDYVATCKYMKKRFTNKKLFFYKRSLERRINIEDILDNDFLGIGVDIKAHDGPTTFKIFNGMFIHAILKRGEENEW